ncbi:MAG: lycopene cyclase family protein, partial [Gammaproteobacteria bacterium]|nr:lycopene cyclase family protein [Gammaproteobacteria bacterium]
MSTVLLAGGGLANGLIAWRLRMRRPEVTITMVEQSASLGGNHTWSFHAGDVTAEQLRWLRPLVAHEWPGQRVRFPEYERRLDAAYFSLTSESLREGLRHVLADGILTGTPIAGLDSRGAVLGDGKRLDADLVIDGRGVGPTPGFAFAWQKFLGTELE